jgi:hypothetical protein
VGKWLISRLWSGENPRLTVVSLQPSSAGGAMATFARSRWISSSRSSAGVRPGHRRLAHHPATNFFCQQIGNAVGPDIAQEGTMTSAVRSRWRFTTNHGMIVPLARRGVDRRWCILALAGRGARLSHVTGGRSTTHPSAQGAPSHPGPARNPRIRRRERWVPDPTVLRNPSPQWAVSRTVLDVCLPEVAA